MSQPRPKSSLSRAGAGKGVRSPDRRPGRPGGKRDTNRKEQAVNIARAGVQLFLDRGVEGVTIDDIARAAGVAKGSFYRYFADKTALVEGIVAPLRATYASAIDATEENLRRARDAAELSRAYEGLAMGLLPVAFQYPDAIRLYLQESRSPGVGARAPLRAMSDQIAESAVRLTETAVEHGLLRVEDPRISAFAVVGAIEHLLLAVIQGRLELPPQRIVATLINLVIDGLRPR
jgi:AcrR family transcriptional regulator